MKMPTDSKDQIRQALIELNRVATGEGVKHLLEILGYATPRFVPLDSGTPEEIIDLFGWQEFREDKGFLGEWSSIDCLFQVTEEEIVKEGRLQLFKADFDKNYLTSYLFLGLTLKNTLYSRGKLAAIAREINRQSPIPILVVFRYGDSLTLSIIDRRPHPVRPDRDVLEKITLIKDIQIASPHRAHIEILHDLALFSLKDVRNFDDLHREWQRVLDTSELNKKFFQEVSNWYFWAIQTVILPDGGEANPAIRNAIGVIRLITRLIFVWFLKEKGLIPPVLFEESGVQGLLKSFEGSESSYYKAILQNLFFATLNTEMNSAKKPNHREFRKKAKTKGGRDQHYGNEHLYRYEDYFTEPDRFLHLCSDIPFLNGGLFECLDKREEKPVIRIDDFSDHEVAPRDRPENPLHFPNDLFFGTARRIDLNPIYGTSNRKYEVRGLIEIFNRYKFTIDENTPVEEEIALDPELLGKVFENLLAEYNPETETTARKQTGSFYTPREIVNYMVDESSVAYLQNALLQESVGYREIGSDQTNLFGNEYTSGQLTLQRKVDANPFVGRENELNESLHHLLNYNDEPHRFGAEEVEKLIGAIDRVKIIDIACGSGAFPMGVLQKLVFILGKLDPNNTLWKQQQKEREIQPVLKDIQVAKQISYEEAREEAIRKLENRIQQIEEDFEGNEKDYARKLFLIENCIFGVDIQAIAVQIAKLRFLISLIVDQTVNDAKPNRGILPLPNLETKFVAANSLIGIDTQLTLRSPAVLEKEAELKKVCQVIFQARTSTTKQKYRDKDRSLRQEICELLKATGFESATADTLARWNPYDFNASSDFFDPEWMFGVADFDICIGNPPYVRADSGEQHLALRQKILASNRYETLWEKWDLYIPFIELGYQLLKPNGVTTMIVSDAYCHSKYAQKSQKWFLENSRIVKLDFLGKIKIFDAGVLNITYLFQKSDGRTNKPERRVHEKSFGNINLLPTDEQRKSDYRVFFPEDNNKSFFEISTVLLKNIFYISVGMVVNSHEEKSREVFTMADLVSDRKDKVHSKPFVEGKNLDSWLPVTNRWLEWGTHRAPALFRRPTFAEIYLASEKILAQRSPGSDPKACYDNQKLHFTESSVGFILWHSLSGVCNNSLKKTARYGNEKPSRSDLPQREELEKNSRRFSIKYVLGVMNSNVARDFLRANRRSNIHLYPDDWKKLPIPDVSVEQQQPIVNLVDRILAIKRQNPHANTDELETEIDQIVYQLYGLTEEEITLVEEATQRK